MCGHILPALPDVVASISVVSKCVVQNDVILLWVCAPFAPLCLLSAVSNKVFDVASKWIISALETKKTLLFDFSPKC